MFKLWYYCGIRAPMCNQINNVIERVIKIKDADKVQKMRDWDNEFSRD